MTLRNVYGLFTYIPVSHVVKNNYQSLYCITLAEEKKLSVTSN